MIENVIIVDEIRNDLIAVGNGNPYETYWGFCKICVDSKANLNWTLSDLTRLFVEPISVRNYRIFFKIHDAQVIASAFITWAFLSDEVLKRVLIDYEDPMQGEWNFGENLFVIDLVSTHGDTKDILKYMHQVVFSDVKAHCGYALRRGDDGKVKRIARWKTWKHQ